MQTSRFVLTLAAAITASANAQWATFQKQTSTRMVASASLIVNPNLEHDFAVGDFDKDGDLDLACMRKFPGSVQGGFRDILFMNESGVLVDRTAEFGSAADAAGSQGMLDPANDRDVEAFDVNNDGWLDLITVTTMSDQVSAMLGQPRVYRNLGNNAQGQWQGFRFEDNRIPTMVSKTGVAANPRACDAAVADYTGDGYVDIYFVDYDTPETVGQTICFDLNSDGDTSDAGECQQSPAEDAAKDYDNRLLINQGAANPGFFTDSGTTRMTAAQLASEFGNMCEPGDMNLDGRPDVVRVNTLTAGQDVAVYYPNAGGTSFTKDVVYPGLAPYGLGVDDLNGDGKLDFIVADDGQDRYCLNTGNGTDGLANFTTYVIAGSPSEFGNTISIADLNNDGRKDVIVTDVDSDLGPFCPSSGRTTKFYRNTGTDSALLVNEAGTVPSTEQTGWTDAALFDINGDGWKDMVSGTCGGINVYMNTPPINMSWSIVGGAPATVPPGQATSLTANAAIVGGGSIVSGSTKLFTRINNGAWSESALTPASSTQFLVNLPALDCGQSLDWYISAQLSNTGTATWTLPSGGAAGPFSLDPVSGTELVYSSEFENGTEGWTVENTSVTFGAWQLGDPIGTNSGATPVQPELDNSASGVNCWFTGQGAAGGTAGAGDLDGGPTVLVSPVFTTGGQEVSISYARWFACVEPTAAEVDSLTVDVRVDGGAWRNLETFTSNTGYWTVRSGNLSSAVSPGNTLQIRFVARDNPNNSTTEAAIDSIRIERVVCTQAPACTGDLDDNGAVDGADLGTLLGQWGGAGSADLDGNGTVDGADLGVMLGAWGACP
jgi:hypothetical protein